MLFVGVGHSHGRRPAADAQSFVNPQGSIFGASRLRIFILFASMIPPKPAAFAAHLAPDSVEVEFVPFFEDRKRFDAPPKLLRLHTNAGNNEGSVESAWNHTNAVPNENTLPHYQVDRDGRARKMCPSDRPSIANGTVSDRTKIKRSNGTFLFPWNDLPPEEQDDIKAHGNVQHWSLAIETADTGTKHDPEISAFTPIQAEVVAQIIAFESIVHGFPISMPSTWHDAGVATHTEPAGFPFWTIHRGKPCPGGKKKAQLRDWSSSAPARSERRGPPERKRRSPCR